MAASRAEPKSGELGLAAASQQMVKLEPRKSWKIFSFDKRKDSAPEKLNDFGTQLRSKLGFEPASSELTRPDQDTSPSSNQTNVSSVKAFERKSSFTAMVIKPNYYMRSLEYYYKLEKPEYFGKLFKEHFQHSFNSMKFVKMINREDVDRWVEQSKLSLKKRIYYNDKKTLIFDLDETLVHCNEGADLGDTNIKISFPNGKEVEASIFFRPHAREILQELSKHYEIIVFTASHKGYADKAIDLLDPSGTWISHRLFREHCYYTKQGVYIKDLRIINRKLKDMLIVDNMLYSYALHIENGIPIVPFYNYKNDAELLMLKEYLMALKDEEDVRLVNRAYFKYDSYDSGEPSDTLDACFDRMFSAAKHPKPRGTSKGRSSSAALAEPAARV